MRGDPMKEEVLIFNILKNLGCDGILITDSKGEVVCIEEEFFREVWELNPKELLGKSVFELEKSGVIRHSLAGRVIETKQPLRLISAVRGLYNIVGEAFPLMDEFNQQVLFKIILQMKNCHVIIKKTRYIPVYHHERV